MKSKKQHPDTGLHCSFCNKDFKYESERKRHEQSHSPQFQCKVCSKKFSFLSALRRHEKQHERTGNVVCDECNRKFRDESLLKRHIQYAHKGSFTCSKCKAIFSSELALRSHTKTHKPVAERKYRCSFVGCSKSFNFSHHWKHHELTHNNMKQYYCNVCGKGFIQYHYFKSHKKIHEPKVACGISGCKMTFASELERNNHVAASHNNDIRSDEDNSYENKSYCDIAVLTQSDTIECASCKQILLREHYPDHLENCVAVTATCLDVKSPTVDISITKLEPVKIDFDNDIGSCKSFVGGCILGADTKATGKCLCAQISAALPADDYFELTTENSISSKSNGSDIVKPNDSVKVENACDTCECGSFKSELDTKTNESKVSKDDLPEIVEYRRDGTVRIKESFDLDLEPQNKKVELVPYSCKAVLGNCIVSGNGTIGEGCLCARMAVDEQQLMTQEIEDLTPCPSI